jgi:hypothetical protein
VATAFASALAIVFVARIGETVGLSRRVTIAFTVVYAISPIVVYTAANGMSEAWSFLTSAVVLLGFLRWSKDHRVGDLALTATGLAGVLLVRYEGLLLAPLMAAITALNDGVPFRRPASVGEVLTTLRTRLPRWLMLVTALLVPSAFVFGLWLLMQLIIAHDPFYWYKEQKAIGSTTRNYANLPKHKTLLTVTAYSLKMSALVIPALAVLAPVVIFVILRRRSSQSSQSLAAVGLLAGALLWPAIVAVGVLGGTSAGAPRYFEAAIVFVTAAAMWLAAWVGATRGRVRVAGQWAIVTVLAVGAVVGAASLDNPGRAIDGEHYFFGRVFGHYKTIPNSLFGAPMWRQAAADLDVELARGGKVLIDASVDHNAFVFTRYPNRYIIDSDRDYERIIGDPASKFDYIMVFAPGANDLATQGPRAAAFGTILANRVGGEWVKWKSYYSLAIYHWVSSTPTPPSSGAG